MERKLRRKILTAENARVLEPTKSYIAPYSLLDGFALDYNQSYTYQEQDIESFSYTMVSDFEVAYGDVQITVMGDSLYNWVEEPNFTWVHRRPENPFLQEVYLGYHITPSLQLVTGAQENLGLLLSNYPIGLSESPYKHTFTGKIMPNWEVELYRDDELIAFTKGDNTGRYIFQDIRLPYGTAVFKKVFYGQLGRERVEVQKFNIYPFLVSPGKTRYKLGVARNPLNTIDDYSQIMAFVERGITRSFTMTASAAHLEDFPGVITNFNRNYFSIGSSIGFNDLILQPFIVTDQTDYAMGFDGTYSIPYVRFYFDGSYQKDFISPVTPFIDGEPLFSSIGLEAQSQITRIIRENLSVKINRFATKAPWIIQRNFTSDLFINPWRIGFNLTLQYQETEWEKEKFIDRETTVQLSEQVFIKASYCRAGIEYLISDEQFSSYYASAYIPVMNLWLQLSYNENLLTASRIINGSTSIPLGWGIFSVNLFTGTNGYGFGFSLNGNINCASKSRKISVAQNPLTGYGSFLGKIFLDLDGDGYKDDNELGLAGVQLIFDNGQVSSKSDEQGILHISYLNPYIYHTLSVDVRTLPDPFYFPSEPAISVMARPGKTIEIPIPITAAGEITGTVTVESRRSCNNLVPGLDIILLDEKSKEISRAKTEFDGFFDIEKVPPGKYILVPDVKQLRILQRRFLNFPIKPVPAYREIVIQSSVEPVFIDNADFKLIPVTNAIIGTVSVELNKKQASKIEVILITEKGKEIARTQIKHDGFYCINKIPPGKYIVILDEYLLQDFQEDSLRVLPAGHEIVIPDFKSVLISNINFRVVKN